MQMSAPDTIATRDYRVGKKPDCMTRAMSFSKVQHLSTVQEI